MTAAYLARNRHDLAAFVRQRRETLQPEAFGFEVRPNRRTKGLRREEVAAIAGVGLTWYTWFEQGRDINVSKDFLDRLARALQLNPSEHSYLHFLAGQPLRTRPQGQDVSVIEPSLRRLTDAMGVIPAYVKNYHWDLLHWNKAAAFVFGDFSQISAEERNIAWLTFSDSRMRRTMVDWEADAGRLVARLRADYARASGDPSFAALIDRLMSSSSEFERIWQTQAVLETAVGTRLVDVDGVGIVSFDYTVCRIGETDQTKLVIYAMPPDEPKHELFTDRLAEWSAQRAQDAGSAPSPGG